VYESLVFFEDATAQECCSVLPSVAVCCSVLQCVASCCSLSYMCGIFCKRLNKVLSVRVVGIFEDATAQECCRVLQCVAVCCSVLQCITACCSVSYMCGIFCTRLNKVLSVRIVGIFSDANAQECCSVLPSVAVCCSVLQRVAVCRICVAYFA